MFRIRSRTVSALSLGALLMLTLGVAPVSAAAPRTLMVDDDGNAANGNCGAATTAYSTIQSAIDAAHHGDTVKVCPGDYTENLTVGPAKDHLTIIGTKAWKAHIWRSTSLTGDTPLVDIGVGADGVVFRHMALVFPTTDDCDSPTVAAIAVEGTNALIVGNRIRSDGSDLFYTCGFQAGVDVAPDNIMTASAAPLPAGLDVPVSAAVGWNDIREFQYAGVTAFGASTRAHVTRNSVHFGHAGGDCHNAPAPAPIAALGVRRAGPGFPVDCFAFGVWFDAGARGTVDGNVVMSDLEMMSAASVSPAGIPADEPILLAGIATGFIQGTRRVDILDNSVSVALLGIGAFGDAHGAIRDNDIAFTFMEAMAITSEDMDIRRNTIDLTGDGIVLNSESHDNFLRSNVVGHNVLGTACIDDSDGSGTANTANIWVNNTGDTSSPSGLCTPAVPVNAGPSR